MNNAANKKSNTRRFRVYDLNDRLCGVWYAKSEEAAILAALAEGRDAWSASDAYVTGH